MVPNGWRLIALENIADPSAAIRYGVVQIGEHTENGIPIVPIKFIKSIDTAKLHRVSASIEAKYKNSRIHAGDVLISVKGTIGAVGIVPEGFSGNIAREIARIRPSVKYDSNYIAFQLQADHTQREIENLTVGTTRKEFSIHTLKKFEILVPPLNEQQKIVKILSTWDQAISATEKLLENSQQQKKALMQQLLTGKKHLLDERGDLFESKFKSSALKELFSINKGQQLNRDTLSTQGNYAVINGGIEPSGYTDVYNVESNTITISEGGNSCGYISFQRFPFWCGGHCYALSNYKLNIEFIYHLLKFNERQIMRLRVGSGLPNIQKKDLECLVVSYPDCEFEQAKIAEVLSLADQEIETLQKKLDYLKQEKKALMQQLLTGKRRVKV